MKRKSPISVDIIQFYAYDRDQTCTQALISQFPYDNRHDFLVGRNFSGIAIKLEFGNDRYDKGVRREVSLNLVDMTSRCEVSSRNIKVNISKDTFFKEDYVCFPAETDGIRAGHTYKLVVCDDTSSQTLAERVIHLIDQHALPHPSQWYEICDGGLRPAWENELYKTLQTDDGHDYYVRFNLTQKLGSNPPAVLPELELRLYNPDGRHIDAHFREPMCHGMESYNDNRRFVEFPFTTYDDNNGVFYAELLCMEHPIAGFVFDTNARDERGQWFGRDLEPLDEYSPEAAIERWAGNSSALFEPDDFDKMFDEFISNEMSESDPEIDDSKSVNEGNATDRQSVEADNQNKSLLSSLDHLTGLGTVKEKLARYEQVVRFNKMRADKGLPPIPSSLHAMFLGSPGTGKTTVAKMIGAMLHRAGVLSKGHVVVRERATLLGQNYNSESEKTLAAIEEAQGGILLIDEAYTLHQPNDPRDPGKFVIETLLTALADDSNRDWMLVLAGYPDEMKRMFDVNPGLKSRIPDSNIYIFDDFTESELMEIAQNYFTRNNYALTPDAQDALTMLLKADYAQREKNFGNARHIVNMIQTEILPSMAVRVINEGLNDETALTIIQKTDIPSRVVKPATSRPRVGFTL